MTIPHLGRVGSIAVLAVANVLVMSLWFSASAVVPALRVELGLDPLPAALFTSAVQAGFVIGTLASAVLTLADRYDPRRVFQIATLIAAAANGLILVVGPESPLTVALRLITGMCMAGVYPVGMKLVTTWAKGDMGLLVGLLVGALTFGSGVPHLFNGLGGIDWRFTIGAASIAATLGAIAMAFVGLGPNRAKAPPFDPRLAVRALESRALRLANLGYLGHMWELYAVWAWIGVFLLDSFSVTMTPADAGAAAAYATFATIAIGCVGSVFGGLFADRMGRTTLTIIALAVSGVCCLVAGFFHGGSPWLLITLCLVWGIAIVADSAQFSASVAELSEPQLVGTMLTVQTCAGFLLTMITIHLLPALVELVGWRYAFVALALGPLVGIVAMARLRLEPEAIRIAGGRR